MPIMHYANTNAEMCMLIFKNPSSAIAFKGI